MAKDKNIDLWFEDECHFQQHGSRCAMWIPPEDVDPIVYHAPTRKQKAVFGAVCSGDGRLATMAAERFNAQTFRQFLGVLLRRHRPGHKMVVILDNARWHHACALQPWLQEHRRVITLDFLPAYSPELNPIERVWKLTRTLCTHNQYFESLSELASVIEGQFARWHNPNKQLKKLCAII
jgi:transposase